MIKSNSGRFFSTNIEEKFPKRDENVLRGKETKLPNAERFRLA